MSSLIANSATPEASATEASSATSRPAITDEYRLKRMQEIVRAVNEKIAPELRALQMLRQPNAAQLTTQLAKRYY